MARRTGQRGYGRGMIATLALSCAIAGAPAPALAAAPAPGAEPQTVEQLQAAVILTFARFVEWSPAAFVAASAPIVIGVVADETVAEALEAIARGRNVAGRTISVRRLQWDSDDAGIHMLFLGATEKRHLALVVARVRARPIVTVSPLPEFGRAGGMITLTLADGRITFAVNSGATASSGVRLSSLLLTHASRVSDESSKVAR
jgi:hypothetical protein